MSKRKLLLADDSITIQKVVNLTFADEGIEVISVGDGDSAMRKFDEFMPDLVMADVNMPGINGYEVCRIIKQTEETRNIPVILLVGSFEPFDEQEAKSVGADDFLTKPFQSIRQLVNKVTDLLNQGERASEESPVETPAAPAGVDSFADTLEFENRDGQTQEEEFGDAGMDDEMIETSAANDYPADAADSVYQGETSIDYAKTQPLNAEDLKAFNIVSSGEAESGAAVEEQEAVSDAAEESAQTPEPPSFDEEARKLDYYSRDEETAAEEEADNISETEPQVDYYLPNESETTFEKEVSDAETLEPDVSYETEEPRTADFSQAETEPEAESTVEMRGETEEIEEEPSSTETTVAEESAEESTAAETAEETESEPTEETETETTEETAKEEPEMDAETPVYAASSVSPMDFDDGDLLELPPLVEETGIRPSAETPKIEPVAETAAETETVETTTEIAEPQTEQAETATAMSFPPELIEAIAQKVADKISDKTMKDVIPQITELVMKKLAEEKKK